MYNITTRKWITELDKYVSILKKDYNNFEQQETEEGRKQVLKDVRDIRSIISVINQRTKDLRWFL